MTPSVSGGRDASPEFGTGKELNALRPVADAPLGVYSVRKRGSARRRAGVQENRSADTGCRLGEP